VTADIGDGSAGAAQNARGGRNLAHTAVPLVLVAILAATLTPTGGATHGLSLPLDRALADALLNVALFAPLGAALAVTGRATRRVVLLCAMLSIAIETAQFVIPGRYPSVLDVMTNVAGGMVGAFLVRTASQWLRPGPSLARMLTACAGIAALGVPILSLVLLSPSETDGTYFGQWTPELEQFERYRGRVIAVALGDETIPPGPHPRSRALERLLHDGAPLRVDAVAGPAPGRLADLFSIYDGEERELVVVGIDGDDLVLRRRTRSVGAGLESPGLRVRHILRDVAPGDTMRIAIARASRGYCVQLNTARECDLGFSPGEGWRLLVSPARPPRAMVAILDLLWMAGLTLPFGYWSRARATILGCAVLGVSLAVVPRLAHSTPASPTQFAGLALGCGLGWLFRVRVRGVAAMRAGFSPEI